jgi:hypothetical protein
MRVLGWPAQTDNCVQEQCLLYAVYRIKVMVSHAEGLSKLMSARQAHETSTLLTKHQQS